MPETEVSHVLKEPRLVVRKFQARPQHEGAGAVVRRSIGRFELKYFDPFLVLDEFSVSAPSGFPDHPHRGFETVTYMLQGAVTHEDFEGHKGTIGAGDLQWMTAGRGIVHSEMPAAQGIQKGLQLWINLSSNNKMIEPRYQEILSKDIAEATKDGIKVRVIAGEALGTQSPIYTRTPNHVFGLHSQTRISPSSTNTEIMECICVCLRGRGCLWQFEIYAYISPPPSSPRHW
ncbi:hypothetical protein L1049_000998 [Liquidambar formosana]|uniref:Pirin N-terminal domain-containing protein n=1 Tax=Liquidambar formosana TaxID=63359 RepID=A0AAP0NAQ7_LIQFO